MITGKITGLRCVTSTKYRFSTRRMFCCKADGSVTCASADSSRAAMTRLRASSTMSAEVSSWTNPRFTTSGPPTSSPVCASTVTTTTTTTTAAPPGAADAAQRLASSPRHGEWAEVKVAGREAPVKLWVVYPERKDKAPVVLVISEIFGLSEWIRGVADQLAKEGFIALALDLSSGLGPNGGNCDSFRFMDDRMRATQKLTRDDVMGRIMAVRDFAAKMPRSNGRTGSIGFCGGGTNSFTLATDVPEHNASVTYYGAAPSDEQLAKTTAPVLGFYGEDDARIFSTVEPTRAAMKRLGKAYEGHTYAHATHSFLWMQDLGNNFQATQDSWPRTIAFFRQHLNTPAPATR